MNATTDKNIQALANAEKQLTEWGVTADEITPELIQYATNVISVTTSRVGDIVVQFGFATKAEIESHLNTKPANVLTLEHLSERIDNLRPHTQKILAANDKIAYYESLAIAPIHPDLHNNNLLRRFCQDHNCLPLQANSEHVLRLVFAEYATQKEYAQKSRIHRATDAIGKLQQTYGLPTIIFGIAQRDQITSRLHMDLGEELEATDNDEKINFWSESNASTPSQKILARWIALADERKASNIKFTPNHNGTVTVRYRRHGSLRKMPGTHTISATQADEINRFLHTKSIARHTDTAKRVEGRLLGPADGQLVYRTSTSESFLRCSFIPAANEGLSHVMESISIRLLPRNTVSIRLDDINVSAKLTKLARFHLMQDHGLILVVGPTSSGKSTTIAGMVSLYQDIYGDSRNLLSLEQPVERHLEGITQIQVTQSKFESNMAALLRHDPDFIWVGELRDRPSASTCVRAANTGHIVVSTLHADDTPSAYNALLSYINNNTGSSAESVVVTQYDAISALSLIIAQRLIPTLCPSCKLPVDTDTTTAYTEYCSRNGFEQAAITDSFMRNPNGCPACDHEGYVGELPINEVLPITRDLRKQLIVMANDGKNDLDILARHRPYTLYDEAMRLVLAGKVALDDALI